MKLSEQIKSKIEKQKAVGHDSAAVVSYEMLNRWLDEAHELEQKLNIHSVMQAEGSDVSEGAAVGQRSVGTNAEVRGCETCKHLEDYESYPCSKCDEDYSMWEAPSGGHL